MRDTRFQALSDEGDLYTWGANSYGQLGTGNKSNCCSPTRVAEELGRIVDIAAIHYCHISAIVSQVTITIQIHFISNTFLRCKHSTTSILDQFSLSGDILISRLWVLG